MADPHAHVEQHGETDHSFAQYLNQLTAIGKLSAVFQPLVPLPWSGESEVIYEVLARIRQADGRVLPAAQFLGADGLSAEATDHLILHAIGNLLAEHPGKTFSLNVAPQSLCNEVHYHALSDMIRDGTLDPAHLMLEISESALESPDQEALITERAQALRAQGLRIALDEFGSGKQGLQRLANSHFDMVKIAKHLDISSEQGRAIAEMLVSLLKGLSSTVSGQPEKPVAICFSMTESQSHFDRSLYLGADYVQGHLFGEPGATLPDSAELTDQLKRFIEQIGRKHF